MEVKMKKIAIFLLVIFSLGIFAGCSSNNKTDQTQTTQALPTVSILSPVNGATLTPGDIKVSVEINNFSLVEKATNNKNEGHIHYYLDVDPSTSPSGSFITSTQTTYTWPNVSEGTHTIAVQLVNVNHAPLDPAVVSKITVNVKATDNSQGIPKEETNIQQTISWKPDGVISQNEYKNSKELGRFSVHWTNDDTYLYMAIKGQTSGWVSIGFEPTDAMRDADMVFGWISNNAPTVLDVYSTGAYGPHPPDQELGGRNDLIETGGSESAGTTYIEFKRKLNTGDKYDKVFTKGQNIYFIWGIGSSDSLNSPHSSRGSGNIVLD